jgi:HAD superfamily 5'-nucleotidase-like hydrolase
MENTTSITSSDENHINELEKELLDKKIINSPIDRSILSKADVIGFDIDHTLSIYNTKNMIELLYTSFVKFLVEHKNYPKGLYIHNIDVNSEDKKFNDHFVKKYATYEGIIDTRNGNVINIDDNKKVIKAFHGIAELTEDEIEKFYGKEKEYVEFQFECTKGDNYHYIFGNFELHVVPLFLLCVHLYDTSRDLFKNTKVTSYSDLCKDVFEALVFNYHLYDEKTNTVGDFRTSGYYFPEIYNNPKKYLNDYSAKNLLKHLREKGIYLFFATNSFYEYADFIMKNTIGEDYHDYFDLGFYWAKKPKFFESGNNHAFHIDLGKSDNKGSGFISDDLKNDKSLINIINEKKYFIEGSYQIVEEYFKQILNKENLSCIYIGDNIGADCLKPSSLVNWRSIAVCNHLSTGFIGNNPAEINQMWNVTNEGFERHGNFEKKNVFYSHKVLRDNTIIAIPAVESLINLEIKK